MAKAWEVILQSLPDALSGLEGQSLSELVAELLHFIAGPEGEKTRERSPWGQRQELNWRDHVRAALHWSGHTGRSKSERHLVGAISQEILREQVLRDAGSSGVIYQLRALLGRGSNSVEGSGTASEVILSAGGLRTAEAEQGNLHRSRMQGLFALMSGGTVFDPALKDRLGSIESRLQRMVPLMEEHTSVLASNTEAIRDNTSSRSSSQSGTPWLVPRGLSAGIWSTITLSPLISGLIRLFGGASKPEPVLRQYSWPERLSLEGGLTGGAFAPVDYFADGSPRILEGTRTLLFTPITVNVQAMDTRSFVDRKNEIAAALKEALLNAHSVADVLWELQE